MRGGTPINTLDIGCGLLKEHGAIGIDRVAAVNPDVVHDLDVFPYPFEDNTFDRMIMRHVVEHLSDIVKLMEELHRIGKPGAVVDIVTPHFSSSNSWTDPTHKQHLGFYSFDFFAAGDGMIDFYTQCRFEVVEKKLDFLNRYKYLGIGLFANKFPRTWEKYYCYIFPARNMTFRLRVVK
ncbi:MAG: class I SAM-dependent methyltransferase [bacterium]